MKLQYDERIHAAIWKSLDQYTNYKIKERNGKGNLFIQLLMWFQR